jgi:hypothetical protein
LQDVAAPWLRDFAKPQRLRADGKPDRRSPPKEHRFKKEQPSPNPDGARKHKTKPKSRTKAATIEELLATEVLLPSGEVRTYGEVITLKQIKAASEGSTAAFNAIQAARARGGPPPEPESPELIQERRRLSLHLLELVEWGARLKRAGLTGKGDYGFLPPMTPSWSGPCERPTRSSIAARMTGDVSIRRRKDRMSGC